MEYPIQGRSEFRLIATGLDCCTVEAVSATGIRVIIMAGQRSRFVPMEQCSIADSEPQAVFGEVSLPLDVGWAIRDWAESADWGQMRTFRYTDRLGQKLKVTAILTMTTGELDGRLDQNPRRVAACRTRDCGDL